METGITRVRSIVNAFARVKAVNEAARLERERIRKEKEAAAKAEQEAQGRQ